MLSKLRIEDITIKKLYLKKKIIYFCKINFEYTQLIYLNAVSFCIRLEAKQGQNLIGKKDIKLFHISFLIKINVLIKKLVYKVHLLYEQDDVVPFIGNLKEEKPCVCMFQYPLCL
jgi:hypothetical protein